jgi:aminobenzoyl-glutamate utilization protein B
MSASSRKARHEIAGRAASLLLGVLAAAFATPSVAEPSAVKLEAVNSVDRHAAALTELSDRIWAYAEIAFREHRSAAALADFAQSQGFRVERGVAGMPTAFVATFGQGRPVIGVMGEYDALPGLSQKALPEPVPLAEGAAGHGCGHNLFGAASLGAAIAIKEQIAVGRLQGTVVFFGTPAEEDVGGKIYMARDGLFDDVDAMLAWHPSDENLADVTSSQAMVDVAVEFRGTTAHAAYDPWNARSAVDAVELFTHGVSLMREHVRPSTRMHYTIASGGDVPNVVAERAKVWLWVRDWRRAEGGSWEMLVNESGGRLLHDNLTWLGSPVYTEQEQAFARQIQRATGVPELGMFTGVKPLEGQQPEGGSTDVADVSWVVPTLHLSVATSPHAAPWHAWPVAASGGMSIGHKGMLLAARTLAATMVDLYEQPAALEAVRAEFKARKGDTVYRSYVPDGPPPLPKP